MLKKCIAIAMASVIASVSFSVQAYSSRYDRSLCRSPNYVCYQTSSGKVVAVKRNKSGQYGYRNDAYRHGGYRQVSYKKRQQSHHVARAVTPPPNKIEGGNIVKVDLGNLTWGAYDTDGNLLKYGRVSGGKGFCPDIGRKCRTVTGTFTVYNKRGAECKSTRFPVGKGGAPMPYCMFFKGGYAMHGSNSVPDYNASHGCVRMAPSDAQWLNQEFVRVGSTRVSVHY